MIPKSPKSSAAFLIYKHKLLMLLRDDVPDLAGANCWSLPGGVVEEGETHDEGLRRELQEEISVVPKEIKFLDKVTYSGGRVGAYYFAELNDGEVKELRLGNEGQKMEFFDFENIKELPLFGSIKKLSDNAPNVLREILKGEPPTDLKQMNIN